MWRQNRGNVINRYPVGPGGPGDPATLSAPIYDAQKISPDTETQTQWSQWGTFYPRPYFGTHDGLQGRMMMVSQADFYNSEPNPFPATSTGDWPNYAYAAEFGLLRLAPSTSAHPGSTHPTGPGPAMIFHAPPPFGMQTEPIYALGV